MNESDDNEKVPVFRTWKTWYVLVIGSLLVMMGLFYFLTKHYS